MMDARKAADICTKAADYIEEHGWTRGNYHNHGRVCMSAALAEVEPNRDLWELRCFISDRVLGGRSIPAWNDRQKSRVPVLAKLRETANLLLAQSEA